MARLVHAGRQLLEEQGSGAPVGDLDPLGLRRAVQIDREGVDLHRLAADERVAAVAVLGSVVLVDFVRGRRAELTHRFDVS